MQDPCRIHQDNDSDIPNNLLTSQVRLSPLAVVRESNLRQLFSLILGECDHREF